MIRPVLHRRSPPAHGSGLRPVLLLLALAVSAAILLRPEGRLAEGGTRVIDGDSLRVGAEEVRLEGVDAPELQQTCERAGRPYPCGEEARAALAGLIERRPVSCRISGRDRYGRSLGHCRVGGEDLGAWLVAAGWAVGYGAYAREEAAAHRRGAGLWAGSFERPSEWRQAHPRS